MFRTTSRRTLIAAAALAMTGCGFRLRGRFSLPFETLYNAYGDAREYELKLEVSFRLAAPDGALYLPDTVIPAVREISYNEEDYLTRDTEEALVINEMLSDIVVQMVRRIEKAQPPKQPEDLTTR